MTRGSKRKRPAQEAGSQQPHEERATKKPLVEWSSSRVNITDPGPMPKKMKWPPNWVQNAKQKRKKWIKKLEEQREKRLEQEQEKWAQYLDREKQDWTETLRKEQAQWDEWLSLQEANWNERVLQPQGFEQNHEQTTTNVDDAGKIHQNNMDDTESMDQNSNTRSETEVTSTAITQHAVDDKNGSDTETSLTLAQGHCYEDRHMWYWFHGKRKDRREADTRATEPDYTKMIEKDDDCSNHRSPDRSDIEGQSLDSQDEADERDEDESEEEAWEKATETAENIEAKVVAACSTLETAIAKGQRIPVGKLRNARCDFYSSEYLECRLERTVPQGEMTFEDTKTGMDEFCEGYPWECPTYRPGYRRGTLKIAFADDFDLSPFPAPKYASLDPIEVKSADGVPIWMTFLGNGFMKLKISLEILKFEERTPESSYSSREGPLIEFSGIFTTGSEIREQKAEERRNRPSPKYSMANSFLAKSLGDDYVYGYSEDSGSHSESNSFDSVAS